MENAKKQQLWLFGILLLWFCVNLLFLTRYPLVHSDETWLSGLTRNMMVRGSLQTTEPFFDLKPRFPHAVKVIFHLLQMPLIAVFGYSVFSVRLLSLIFGVFSLYMVYRCLRDMVSFPLAISLMAAISVNGQFIHAAHTARQEILLLFVLLWCLHILLHSKGAITTGIAVRLALLTGLSAGLHPNSVLIAAGCGFAMLFVMLINKRFQLKLLMVYTAITGGLALVFVGISFWFDQQFVPHWLQYGDTEFELLVPAVDKFGQLFAYLGRLWNRTSGTYILPELKPQLVLSTGLFIYGFLLMVRNKSKQAAVISGMVFGAFLATILIGRYNQLSAILWMFPGLMLLAVLPVPKRFVKLSVILLSVVFLIPSVGSVLNAYQYNYNTYIDRISTYVSPDTKVLANLNTGFYFENDMLLDIRNLTYLKENEMNFAEYVESRGIKAIVWSDEMSFIYNHRPNFNVLYGNPRYVPEAEKYFKEHCTLAATFEDIGYGNRIVQLIGEPCVIRIYSVNP